MNRTPSRTAAARAVGAISLAAIVAAGCHKGQRTDSAMGQAGPSSMLEAPGFDPKDPVAVSTIRERALTTIEDGAKSPDAQTRANSVEAASLAPERLSPIVVLGLEDHNAGVRTVAAMAVGKARLTKLTPRVRLLLDDQSPFVKAAAIFALAKCGADVDRSPLAGMLLRDPSQRVRSHVAYILGELGDASALPLLQQAIRERTAGISPEQFNLFQLQVTEAMVKLGDREQCGVIQAALHPSHPEELEAIALAAQLIGEVQDNSAAAQLVSLADFREVSRDPKHPSAKKTITYPAEVRMAAAAALSTLGIRGTAAPAIADEYAANNSAPIRAQAAYVYGQVGGTDQWGKLDTMMGDPESTVRVAAAAAILRSKPNPN